MPLGRQSFAKRFLSGCLASSVCAALISLSSTAQPGDQEVQRQKKPPTVAFSKDEKTVGVHYEKGEWTLRRPVVTPRDFQASGKVLWVATTGDDANGGSTDKPFRTIGKAVEAGEAVVHVQDNGVGIPAEMLPRVFDLFTQVDTSLSRSLGGLGIGLALVGKLVEMHGGTVRAASAGPGKGGEFTVRLPVLADPPAREPEAAPKTAGPGRALRVLSAEDNVDSGDSLGLLLRLRGHEVLVARNGPAVLEAAPAFRPDVVILDIGLPGLDGYEVAGRLRQRPEFRGVTLCALTGYTPSEADRQRPERALFNHQYIKPVGLEALLAMLETVA